MKTRLPGTVNSGLCAIAVGALLLIGTGSTTASAATIVFNFNTLSDGASNSSVQSYMRSTIQSATAIANGVTVTGAAAEKDYTGDNHVVGPVTGTTVTSLTLGNSDGSVQHGSPLDAYIYNSDATKIDMVFALTIYSVSFDYEIFPNGTCANPPSTCSVYPDFTFKANGATILHDVALDPGSAGYTGYTHSPDSGKYNTEQAPQLLAVSTTYYFANGVNHLEFYDWPERIGIDNLTITTDRLTTTQTVPEPTSLLLLGTGISGLLLAKRKNTLSRQAH